MKTHKIQKNDEKAQNPIRGTKHLVKWLVQIGILSERVINSYLLLTC
jgi:hypothetical protein